MASAAHFALATTDTTVALLSMQVPTPILVGEQDALTLSASQEMRGRIRGSEMRVIKKAAHLSNIENTDEFNRYVTDLLNKLHH